jgi:hypothetical protein
MPHWNLLALPNHFPVTKMRAILFGRQLTGNLTAPAADQSPSGTARLDVSDPP